MVRKKTDPFWKHVEIRPKDRWMCKFCGNEYPGHVSRIKAHLGQVKNRGIDTCDKVRGDVKEQALKALNLDPTERQEDMVGETAQGNVAENISSIHSFGNFDDMQYLDPSMYNQNVPGDASHDVMSQSLPLSTEFPNVGTSSAAQYTQFQPTVVLPDSCIQQHGMNSLMDSAIVNFQPHNEGQPAGVDMLLPSTSGNFDEQLGALKRKVEKLRKEKEENHWLKKVKKIRYAYGIIEEEWREGKRPSLQEVNQLEMWIREADGLGIPSIPTKASPSATHKDSHPPPLITTKLIGRDEEMLEIWNYLVQDDILRVGIYGMGGVGKTEIAMRIYNKLLENESFDHVFWATMPQDVTIYEIQEVIGNAVHLDDLLMEKNEKIRAAMLHQFLISKKKLVLILDDLWRHFEFYDVGIPVKFLGLKLVITSRSLDVCRTMLCQAQIRISPPRHVWFRKDDFNLLLVKLGLETELPRELKKIAKQLLSTCKGLPLYITAIAKRMRGVKDVRHWKDMLEKMKDPKERFKEMKQDVYNTLKLSYNSLDDHQLQQCLIFSALYLSNRRYRRRRRSDLVEFLIDVGLILGMDSRQKLFDKAHAILDKLESACLLDGNMKMHDSIMDMALNIRSDKVPCVSHSAIGLKDILDKELWFEGLDKISLLIEGREESSSRLTNSSKISVLLSFVSCDESYLEEIPDEVLRLLPGLRILDLSCSNIKEIPHSVSDLISLTALVLRFCEELVHIPYIGKLTSLQKLDLHCCCSLTNLPDGLERLVKLKYLDLYKSGVKNLPGSILRNLRKLQYLWIYHVKAEKLVRLNKLESLRCSLSTVGRVESHKGCISLPKNIQYLCVDGWSNKRIAPLKYLEALEIIDCVKFGVIFGDQNEGFVSSNSNAFPFPNLKKLCVVSCSKLKYIFGPRLAGGFSSLNIREIKIDGCENFEGIVAAPSGIVGGFLDLEKISISSCKNMRNFVVPEMLPCLKNLRSIDIDECENFEGIIAAPSTTLGGILDLEEISISSCKNIRNLVVPEMLPCLKNLRSIDIKGCENFEGIVAAPSAILGGFPNLENISISTFENIWNCGNMRSLLVVPEMLPCLQNLRSIFIWGCNLKTLVSIEVFLHLQHLEKLDIFYCPYLEMIIEPASSTMPLTASANTHLISHLTSLRIKKCPKIKRLLSHEILPHLCNLQSLEVERCDMLEELTDTYDEQIGDLYTVTPPPNLKTLGLEYLPRLRSIDAISVGSSIEVIIVKDAPQLKRIPLRMCRLPNGLSAPPSSLKNIIIDCRDWWESLEWESPGVKDILETYVELDDSENDSGDDSEDDSKDDSGDDSEDDSKDDSGDDSEHDSQDDSEDQVVRDIEEDEED